MSIGYSGTPLIKKLGIKEQFKMLVINEPVNYFDLLGQLPVGVSQVNPNESADFVHFFTKEKEELVSMLPQLKSFLVKNDLSCGCLGPKKPQK